MLIAAPGAILQVPDTLACPTMTMALQAPHDGGHVQDVEFLDAVPPKEQPAATPAATPAPPHPESAAAT